ncbi:MAG TPA: hypothetical protein VIQ29_13625 [Ancylobacter sp.]
MNKLILAAAAVASLGLSVAAHAESRDPAERAAYNQTVREQSLTPSYNAQSQAVYEGRNATTTAPTAGVEPYIAQEIEANARSTH